MTRSSSFSFIVRPSDSILPRSHLSPSKSHSLLSSFPCHPPLGVPRRKGSSLRHLLGHAAPPEACPANRDLSFGEDRGPPVLRPLLPGLQPAHRHPCSVAGPAEPCQAAAPLSVSGGPALGRLLLLWGLPGLPDHHLGLRGAGRPLHLRQHQLLLLDGCHRNLPVSHHCPQQPGSLVWVSAPLLLPHHQHAALSEYRPLLAETYACQHRTSVADKKLILIPLIFICLRVWSTVRFILTLCNSPAVQTPVLVVLHGIGNTFQGGANCIMFVLCTQAFRDRLFSLCCCCCQRLSPSLENSNVNYGGPLPSRTEESQHSK
ncbi:G-protein coupled receptor 157 isoform X2 [Notamacropus eugenii]|uniref:G-protein coupled receptor 157 isoform X2 n=1 Tax=Notamacropus eugenii TaxID=9315 RepID=UPI003B66DBA4